MQTMNKANAPSAKRRQRYVIRLNLCLTQETYARLMALSAAQDMAPGTIAREVLVGGLAARERVAFAL